VVPVIRMARACDLPAILELWMLADAEPGHTDTLESLTKLIARDPGALLMAADGGAIVGSVIAAWDGWRGTVYRLAVAPSHRRRGSAPSWSAPLSSGCARQERSASRPSW
jgi:ribosomal protein S18 acetylase RimI-like enzyme